VLGAGALLGAGWSSDRTGDRVIHAAVFAAIVALGNVGAAVIPTDVGKVVAIIVMQLAVYAFLAPFWALPTMLLSGGSAAVGIALVNAIGNVGGFIGPTVIGFLRERTGGDTGAFLVLGGMAFAASLICLGMTKATRLRKSPGRLGPRDLPRAAHEIMSLSRCLFLPVHCSRSSLWRCGRHGWMGPDARRSRRRSAPLSPHHRRAER
ncbi:MAG TPA: hypothetical protein VIP11_20815, partial [Gemmatimonadaceae bacterium]